MRLSPSLAAALLAVGLGHFGNAQTVPRSLSLSGPARIVFDDETGAPLGVAVSSGAAARDTLGLLIVRVTPGGVAEKAGIEEGTRIAAINGVSLRLAPADIGDNEIGALMTRRLSRELAKVAAGANVELRLYTTGQTRTATVKVDVAYRPEARESADRNGVMLLAQRALESRGVLLSGMGTMPAPRGAVSADRAALGISLGANGSKRDTLGVFVIGVNDAGPAAKAGVEEGQRIGSINGVDLRVSREDAGDAEAAAERIRRLQRTLDSVKAGEVVELHVVGNGQTRTIKVTTVKGSDLPNSEHSMLLLEGGAGAGIGAAPIIIRRGGGGR